MYSELIEKSNGKYDVYMYGFPIERIHPASPIILATIEQVKRTTGKNITGDVYTNKDVETHRRKRHKIRNLRLLDLTL